MKIGWLELAECKGMDTNAFYPLAYEEKKEADAKAVCERCVVRERCLSEAIAEGIEGRLGIRGGMTERERHAMVILDRRRVSA